MLNNQKKTGTNQISPQKIIPDWKTIREIIDAIDDTDLQNILRVSYLFGTSIQELVRGRTREEPLRGNDFSETTIEGEEALLLEIPTARSGWKPRIVAIPLSSRYEKWAEIILNFSEEKADNELYKWTSRKLQYDIKDYFKLFEWPTHGYKKKRDKKVDRVNLTIKHLPEIREWELGLCHNFSEHDFKHFFGKEYDSDYNIYFRKLLRKSDFYYKKDIINAIELKNFIFNPSSSERYYYKEYMNIIKRIKRKFIQMETPFIIKINLDINLNELPGAGESKEHKILKANIKKYLEKNSSRVSYEEANLDIVNIKNGIVVECGHTSARILLDSFNEVYKGIKNINEFWILQFYDEENNSLCYKFIKSKTYK